MGEKLDLNSGSDFAYEKSQNGGFYSKNDRKSA